MKTKLNSWLDWLLYFGSKDERHRTGADRAGHVAFFFCFAAATVDFMLKLPAFKTMADPGAAFGLVAIDLVIVLGGGLLYGLQWVRSGITFADSPTQRLLLRWLAPVAGLAVIGLLLVPWRGATGSWTDRLPFALLWGTAAGVVTGLLFWGLNRWARGRADQQQEP